MNNVNSFYQETVRIQTVVCGLLFSIFSFIYLYVFQCDVLEAFHFSLAHGKTHFSAIGSALVITLILLLIRWGVNVLLKLRGKLRSLAYMPSFFILMALSDIGRDVYLQSSHTKWLWLLPLLICLFIGVAYGFKKSLQFSNQTTDTNRPFLVASNVSILLAGCIMTLLVGNTNTDFHHELQTERFLREQRADEALKVGQRSLDATQTLTALRVYAMSQTGKIGEKLFAYPQYYGSEGLFFPEDSLRVLRYTNDSIYHHLGARPYSGEDRLSYLSRICYHDEGKHTALDYYLSALLLDKQIESFTDAISEFYELEDSLPRYYREAITIYRTTHPEFTFGSNDSTLIKGYIKYRERQTQFNSKQEETNRMRREYGDTYWWYYDYQK